MKKIILLLAFVQLNFLSIYADEGMWLPLLIGQNIEEMNRLGCKLTAEDIYSVNNSSLKDAIVMFGKGCTGSLISDQGLVITNHHCGFGSIQSLSSVDHDYLKNGFWATEKPQELPSVGLTVSFLVKMEDVTSKVLKGVMQNSTESKRDSIIQANIETIQKTESDGNSYKIDIESFYYGNEYYLMVYEVFQDIRLVGAPPTSIGNFGGDTDNWIWPRHTGDFSIFRIYANKDNMPAPYSTTNVPYKPKKFLTISLKGVKQNDFTMVYGFPGTTHEYITSKGVDLITNYQNPNKITLREIRLKIMEEYMKRNDTVNFMYADKQKGIANAWKKWIGESNGLSRFKAINKRLSYENDFAQWVNSNPQHKSDYGQILPTFDRLYAQLKPVAVANDFNKEGVYAVELIKLASKFTPIITEYTKEKPDPEIIESLTNSLKISSKAFYSEFYLPIDRDIFANMMKAINENVPIPFQPNFLSAIATQYQNNWHSFANDMYSQTVFADSLRLLTFLNNFDTSAISTIRNDNIYRLYSSFNTYFSEKVGILYESITDSLTINYRKYMKGIMEMQPQRHFYPDANSTLRVSYGKISGFPPQEAIEYSYFTTIDGVIEKGNKKVYDYVVPEKLRNLYNKKDYGRYQSNGTVPIAFLATNHTSGGNSGSPVLNAEGQLVGLNFDRCWEGTMSDILYDPKVCRNITLDIKYALFVIDKFANAGSLINEMKVVE